MNRSVGTGYSCTFLLARKDCWLICSKKTTEMMPVKLTRGHASAQLSSPGLASLTQRLSPAERWKPSLDCPHFLEPPRGTSHTHIHTHSPFRRCTAAAKGTENFNPTMKTHSPGSI